MSRYAYLAFFSTSTCYLIIYGMLQVDQTISQILFQFNTHFLKKAALNYTQKFVQFTTMYDKSIVTQTLICPDQLLQLKGKHEIY